MERPKYGQNHTDCLAAFLFKAGKIIDYDDNLGTDDTALGGARPAVNSVLTGTSEQMGYET